MTMSKVKLSIIASVIVACFLTTTLPFLDRPSRLVFAGN
jgi:hypothetical protein